MFRVSHLMSRDFRMLAMCLIAEEKRMEVLAGRRDIYTRVSAICWFNLYCSLTNMKRPSRHFAQLPRTALMISLQTRFISCGEESLWHWALLLPHKPLLQFRPCAFRSILSSFQVVPTVQPSNTATNTPSSGHCTCNWRRRMEDTLLFALRCL